MARKLSDLSVAEIRSRYADPESAVSPQVLARLRRDPRQGVRQIYQALKGRYEREREERLRLDGLLNFERVLWKSGVRRIAGVDEAGVGPLAGPVVAAAVVFAPGCELAGVDDSKRLDAERREELAGRIRSCGAAVAVGVAEVAEIDRINVYHAALLAMRRAVEALPEPPEHLLVDAREVPGVAVPQNRFDKGDGLNYSIAAASIIAKTHRDRLMTALDAQYPEYGFARHKGYGTAEHQEAIRRHGPSDVHRLSYPFLRELCGEFSAAFYELRERVWSAADHRALARAEAEVAGLCASLAEEEARKLKLTLRRRWDLVAQHEARR
ncbi:MAG TPA: ribonuclease HII [Thermoanaerobaculia bacterium]|nr:ribonuclease HII [Thermoanaerobaculia bacterium]